MVVDSVKDRLEKQHYRIVGGHSACKICDWTRKSLRNKGVCYKEKFYNIKSHQCCQMTPCLTCPNSCVYCWRDVSMLTGKQFTGRSDDPKEIIKGCIAGQRNLINGFPGDSNLNMLKFKEAQDPKYFAISLSGEPTLYPKLGELIKELSKMKKCSFLVTNGLFPENIKKLDPLPTQLYISIFI